MKLHCAWMSTLCCETSVRSHVKHVSRTRCVYTRMLTYIDVDGAPLGTNRLIRSLLATEFTSAASTLPLILRGRGCVWSFEGGAIYVRYDEHVRACTLRVRTRGCLYKYLEWEFKPQNPNVSRKYLIYMKTPKTFVLEVTHRHILEVIFGHPCATYNMVRAFQRGVAMKFDDAITHVTNDHSRSPHRYDQR